MRSCEVLVLLRAVLMERKLNRNEVVGERFQVVAVERDVASAVILVRSFHAIDSLFRNERYPVIVNVHDDKAPVTLLFES